MITSPLTGPLCGPVSLALTDASRRAHMRTPTQLFALHGGAWFYGWDRTDFTVNSDGTGGAVADGGTIGRWSDRSGNGNHLSQATANLRPIARDGKVSCRTYYASGIKKSFLSNTATSTTFNRNNFSGGGVFGLSGASNGNPIVSFGTDKFALYRGTDTPLWSGFRNIWLYDGTNAYDTGLKWSARKCVITWRANGSSIIINVDGVEATLSGLSSQTMSKIYLSQFDFVGPNQTDAHEFAAFDADIGETEMSGFRAYLNAQASTSSINRNNRVFIIGDSVSRCWLAEDGKGWGERITNRPTHWWHNYAKDGAMAFDHQDANLSHRPAVLASDLISQFGSGENIVIFGPVGYNDRIGAEKTGAQIEAGLGAEALICRNAGAKVIVCTAPKEVSNAEATFNTLIRANWANYATALCDLRADGAFDDNTDNTYYGSGGVNHFPHPNATGEAAMATLIQATMAGV